MSRGTSATRLFKERAFPRRRRRDSRTKEGNKEKTVAAAAEEEKRARAAAAKKKAKIFSLFSVRDPTNVPSDRSRAERGSACCLFEQRNNKRNAARREQKHVLPLSLSVLFSFLRFLKNGVEFFFSLALARSLTSEIYPSFFFSFFPRRCLFVAKRKEGKETP